MATQTDYLNKMSSDMTDAELVAAHQYWSASVEEAAGWASAYFSAKQLQHVCAEGKKRGLAMTNPYPIKYS